MNENKRNFRRHVLTALIASPSMNVPKEFNQFQVATEFWKLATTIVNAEPQDTDEPSDAPE